ncbi:MAG: hypothetical protein JXA71_19695, partial [Chitinispirillaceae bacterium]|nr:hypothetical protein [Chitinispirillaceae bacterium]
MMADFPSSGIFITNDPAADAAAGARLDSSVRALLDSGNLTGVEDLFLARLETSPGDLLFFVPIIRHFVRNRHADIAETLLAFLLDSVGNKGFAESARSLIRAVLSIWPESRQAREFAIGMVETAYGRCPNLRTLMEQFGVRESSDPVGSYKRLESWLRFDVGQGVFMAAHGVGRVAEINPSFNAIRVAFMGAPSLVSFKPDEAMRLLEPLGPGHLLLDIPDRAEEIRSLAATDSGELLCRLFTSMQRELSVAEIKKLLSAVVPAPRWSA